VIGVVPASRPWIQTADDHVDAARDLVATLLE